MCTNLLRVAGLWFLGFISVGASATEISLDNNGWYALDVDPLVSQSGDVEWIDAQVDDSLGYVGDGSSVQFSFSLTAASFLHVVDAGLSGDVFSFSINGVNYSTSAVAADSGLFAGIDFDSAWSMNEFSRVAVLLAPGDYTVTGLLNQSAVDEFGSPYMATLGGLQLVAVDEPGVVMLFGLALAVFGLHRRSFPSRRKLADKGVVV